MNDPDNFVAIEIAQGCGRIRRVAAARAAAALELVEVMAVSALGFIDASGV
jgi:hypothetical protein